MKLYYFFGIIIIIFTITFLTSCSGDNDLDPSGGGDDPVVVDVRPSVVYEYSEEEEDIEEIKYHFDYSGNRLIEKRRYEKGEDDLWDQEEKIVYTYENDIVTIRSYDNNGVGWTEKSVYSRYHILEGKVLELEIIYSTGESIRLDYAYDDFSGDLIKVERFENDELTDRYEYLYNGNYLSECIESSFENGTPSYSYKSDFVYEDYIMKEIINYQYWLVDNEPTWVKFSKDVYTYTNEEVAEINNYYWDMDANGWVDGERSEFFAYYFDSFGLLEEYKVVMPDDEYILERRIEYEPGYGNLESFSDPEQNARNYPNSWLLYNY